MKLKPQHLKPIYSVPEDWRKANIISLFKVFRKET